MKSVPGWKRVYHVALPGFLTFGVPSVAAGVMFGAVWEVALGGVALVAFAYGLVDSGIRRGGYR